MNVEIRAITEDEIEAYCDALGAVYGSDRNEGEIGRLREVLGLENAAAAFEDGRIVGTMGSYQLALVVPGGADVEAAGLTRVSVLPTHRRQGVLRAMMEAHTAQAAISGQPISVLWATDPGIYGRFGYGVAAQTMAVDINTALAGIVAPDQRDRLSLVSGEEARQLVPATYERARSRRPGFLKRSDPWWDRRILSDEPYDREGHSPIRHVIARRDGEPVGYVLYRQHPHWIDNDRPNGTTHVVELVALDHNAEHNLWWYLSTIDLFPNLKIWTEPTDSILPHLATNERAVVRRTNDGLHLRVLDVVTALEARQYDAPGDLVFHVADAGTYRLTVGDDGRGSCRPTSEHPVLSISAFGLGSMYLGAGAVAGLQTGGHLVGEAEAVNGLRRCFAWPVAPWSNDIF